MRDINFFIVLILGSITFSHEEILVPRPREITEVRGSSSSKVARETGVKNEVPSCKNATDGTLLPHLRFPSTYYECLGSSGILRRCPNGQKFDASIGRCSLTDRKKRGISLRINCEYVRSNQPIAYRHENDCSSYYRCTDNVEVQIQCEPGLTFNPVLEDCNAQNDTNCNYLSRPTTESASTEREPSSTSTTEAPKPEGPCPAPNVTESVVLLPHQTNCSLYCLCEQGKLKIQECQDGFHWNAYLQVCTWPENANCTNRVPSSTPTPVIELPDECPTGDTERPIRLPHESKCNFYYECKDGQKNVLQCDDDLVFNPQMQVCVWRENYNCIEKDKR